MRPTGRRAAVAVAAAPVALVLAAALALAIALAGCGGVATAGPAVSASASAAASPSPTPVVPVKVSSVWPHAGAKNVSYAQKLVVRFSTALAARTAHPKLTPKVHGVWKAVSATTLVFRPTGHWPLLTTVRVTVPAGRWGIRGSSGGRLAKAYTTSFTVGGASVLRLQQLLADLGYLPLRFRVSHAASTGAAQRSAGSGAPTTSGTPSPPATAAASPTPTVVHRAVRSTSADLVSVAIQRGVFTWRYPKLATLLGPLWQRGQNTVLVRGALMAFEADQGLTVDGVVGAQVWAALLQSVGRHTAVKHPYDYLEVSLSIPETLRVWRNGRVVYSTAVNTGIASRPTAAGTFPVYARYLSTTMSGTNPDGTKYNDPGVPYVAYFNGGDAVHGFVRGSYGWPQSLGCVELPYSAAAVVFDYDPIGTLVGVH
jgi:peptidoglycan hydrolase-like protein with peptidoglycan-binding domain